MLYNIIIISSFSATLIVGFILKKKFQKYSEIKLEQNLTGKEVAEKMLQHYGVYNVQILLSPGYFSDHYNPMNKTVNLSYEVLNNRTAAAVAIAAHECGHAIQHNIGYKMLLLRIRLTPIVNISSKFSNMIIMLGLSIFYSSKGTNTFILKLGISLFFIAVLFTLITLPVEFDASRRALKWIENENIVNQQEYCIAKDSLKWASMTYIITALGSLAQLMYFLSIFHKRKE